MRKARRRALIAATRNGIAPSFRELELADALENEIDGRRFWRDTPMLRILVIAGFIVIVGLALFDPALLCHPSLGGTP